MKQNHPHLLKKPHSAPQATERSPATAQDTGLLQDNPGILTLNAGILLQEDIGHEDAGVLQDSAAVSQDLVTSNAAPAKPMYFVMQTGKFDTLM